MMEVGQSSETLQDLLGYLWGRTATLPVNTESAGVREELLKTCIFFFVFLRTLSEQLEQTLDVSCAAKYE